MFCPRCGHEQLSSEVRFCSRCGFNLRSVSQLLSGGGLPATVPTGEVGDEELTPRQKGLRQGAKILFAAIVLFPLMVGFSIAVDGPVPLLVSVLLFFAGVCRMLYARLFESHRRKPPEYAPSLDAPPQGAALPPYQPPVNVPRSSPTTGELVEPPSVTEHTTRLLDK